MRIICSKCGEVFESLIIDKEIAYKEVFDKSCKHVVKNHHAMYMTMGKAVGVSVNALTSFMHLSEFVVIPESEVRIQALMEQAQEIVMTAVGFEREEDDEENDDGEDSKLDVGTIELPDEEDKGPESGAIGNSNECGCEHPTVVNS
jgi:heterodisulfide reductase subunit C